MAVKLFAEKEQCSGCGACRNICHLDAISMREDENGFVYPHIDSAVCVQCGACQRICPFQNPVQRSNPQSCYAVASADEQILKKSSSGGAFAVLAASILQKGGIVYGVAMPLEKDGFQPKHIRITTLSELPTLQGSKYVQSDTGTTARQVKTDLAEGKAVLYSGTPCQIAGLQSYLGKKYDNLLTVEIICHGVPGAKMFRDFVRCLEKEKGKVKQFAFRSKGAASVKQSLVCYESEKGKQQVEIKDGDRYSYLFYFMRGLICRESCYSCPFADGRRVADITLGDYWGFHQEHPAESPGKRFNSDKGISCVLVNSEKGQRAIDACLPELSLIQSSFKQIAKHNEQLLKPVRRTDEQEKLLQIYRQEGYSALEEHFASAYKVERLRSGILACVPSGAKRIAKRVIGWVGKIRKG